MYRAPFTPSPSALRSPAMWNRKLPSSTRTSGQTRAISSFLADDLVRRGNQDDQDVERPPAQLDRDAPLGQEPFAREQVEGAERHAGLRLVHCCRHGIRSLGRRLCQAAV